MSQLWLAAAAIPVIAAAQPNYSWELSGLALDGRGTDFELTSIGATYYLDRVEEGGEPYALSAFFDPATLVSATLDRPLGTGADVWTLSGRYLLAGSRWYVGGHYTRNGAAHNPNIFSPEDDAYGVVAGRYLGPRTTLELAIGRSRGEATGNAPVCLTLTCPVVTSVARSDIASLSFLHVRQFRDLTYTFTGGFEQVDSRTTFRSLSGAPDVNLLQPQAATLRTYSVGSTLYPTKAFGVHVGYEEADDGFTDGTYSAGARWFFRRNVALELSLSETKLDLWGPFDDEIELRSFRVIGRF